MRHYFITLCAAVQQQYCNTSTDSSALQRATHAESPPPPRVVWYKFGPAVFH